MRTAIILVAVITLVVIFITAPVVGSSVESGALPCPGCAPVRVHFLESLSCYLMAFGTYYEGQLYVGCGPNTV